MPIRLTDPGATLGALVAEQPSRAEVFERLRLDYCCGGGQTLARACERIGLDVETVCRMLDALRDLRPGRGAPDCGDWGRASLGELCDHIVTAHHDRLRAELPRLDDLVATVVRVHGKGHPELHDLQRLFGGVRRELEAHIETEERLVFPMCRELEAHGAALDEQLLAAHEHEHGDTGSALVALRELNHDYDTGNAYCATHRSLLERLERLELDLHQHIHEENNILFPRARALVP